MGGIVDVSDLFVGIFYNVISEEPNWLHLVFPNTPYSQWKKHILEHPWTLLLPIWRYDKFV